MDGIEFVIERALEMGAIEISGISGTGEIQYDVNPLKMQEFSPAIWDRIVDDVRDATESLVISGIAELDRNSHIDSYILTDRGREYYTDMKDAITAALEGLDECYE